MNLFGFIKQPYPFEDYKDRSHLKKLVSAIGQGAFISFFLIVFEPFGIAYWLDPNKTSYLIGFGVITTLTSVFLNFVVVPLFPSYFKSSKWTLGREILFISLLLLLIAAGNSILLSLVTTQVFSFNTYIFNILSVVLVGIFPVGFGVMGNYIIQLKKYQKPVNIAEHKEKLDQVILIADNEKDCISLAQNQIQYIESADNYAIVYFSKAKEQRKEMLRTSLTRLEDQTKDHGIVRCHRSFMVNLNNVHEVTGNAQGYKLHLNNCDQVVPVARKYSNIVKELKG